MEQQGPTGGERIVQCLEREGVEYIFGLSGGAVMPMFDALVDSNAGVVAQSPRAEEEVLSKGVWLGGLGMAVASGKFGAGVVSRQLLEVLASESIQAAVAHVQPPGSVTEDPQHGQGRAHVGESRLRGPSA